MIWAEWNENTVRARFVEVHSWGDGYQHEIESPVRLVSFAGGSLPGPFFEPRDILGSWGNAEDTTRSAVRYHKKCQYTLPIKALNELIEDTKTGEADPTPLHSFSWEWLD